METARLNKPVRMVQLMRLGIVSAGHLIGDDDVIAQRNYSATVTAMKDDSFVFAIPSGDFTKYFKRPGSKAW
jgi:CRP-like cAMP-binding protein